MAHITDHAILRYQQRVDPVSDQDARAAMLACAVMIDKAAAFGCSTVIMGLNGARLKLQGDVVATVIEHPRKRVRHG